MRELVTKAETEDEVETETGTVWGDPDRLETDVENEVENGATSELKILHCSKFLSSM